MRLLLALFVIALIVSVPLWPSLLILILAAALIGAVAFRVTHQQKEDGDV